MFDFSMGEIGIVAAVALVVLGPDKLPQVAKTAGSLMGRAQRFVAQVKSDIDKEVELSELKKIQEDARKMAADLKDNLKNTQSEIEKEVKDISDTVNKTGKEIEEAAKLSTEEAQDKSVSTEAATAVENVTSEVSNSEQSQWGLEVDKVDTSGLEDAFEWGAQPEEEQSLASNPVVPEVLQEPLETLSSEPKEPTLSELLEEINEIKRQINAKSSFTYSPGRFSPRSHVNKPRISRQST